MTFTTEKPTRPGWFLWKWTASETVPKLCLVTMGDDGSLWRDGKVTATTGEWCRLVPAEEIENAWREGARALPTTSDWDESRAKRVMEGAE